jgi:hypothetical protein
VFEERVQRALRRLEVPSREDLSALIDRVDSLNGELRKLGGASVPRKSAAKKATAKKSVAKKAAPASKRVRKSAK